MRKKLFILSLALVVCCFFCTCKKDKHAIKNTVPIELRDSSFTFGVWLQSPETIGPNNKTNAQNYKEIGINTFIGLWHWPDEVDMYQGYALASMQELKNTNMTVYAGSNQAAINWINAHPEFSKTLVGYILGDEADMMKVNQVSTGDTWEWAQPGTWKATGDALHTADPTRGLYANFGKGFALDPWVGYHVGPGPAQSDDFAKYVAPLSVLSSDFYGITDPWEPPSYHGVWTYGRAVKNTLKSAGTRPVWGVVEASGPFNETEGTSTNQMFQRMQPSLLKPIIWNMVVNGAQGVIYFCHDFTSHSLGYNAALYESGMPAAMKAANESVKDYGAVLLKGANITGTTVSTNGAVNVVVLAKQFNGDTFIFAMGDGNSTYRDGLAVDAEITLSGFTGSKMVEVLSDSRTITMSNGKINDHFEPYELHIYKIDN
jgi:hypothetical protein